MPFEPNAQTRQTDRETDHGYQKLKLQ